MGLFDWNYMINSVIVYASANEDINWNNDHRRTDWCACLLKSQSAINGQCFSLSCRNDSALCTTLNLRVFKVFECWLAEVFSENKTKVKTQFINVNLEHATFKFHTSTENYRPKSMPQCLPAFFFFIIIFNFCFTFPVRGTIVNPHIL